jgi:hypothetical protein
MRARGAIGVVGVAAALGLSSVALAAPLDPFDYQLSTSTETVGPSAYGGGYLDCPKGSRAVPNGALWHRPGAGPDSSVAIYAWTAGASATTDGRAYASGKTSSLAPADLQLERIVLCLPLDQTRQLEIRTKDVASPDADHPPAAHLRCRRDQRVLTGGAYWHEAGQNPVPNQTFGLYVSSSAPMRNGRGWYASGINGSGSDANLEIVALCLPEKRLRGVVARDKTVKLVPPAPNDPVAAGGYVRCPKGTLVLTGGAEFHRGNRPPNPRDVGLATISSSAPTKDAKRWYADGSHQFGPNVRLDVIALCAPT